MTDKARNSGWLACGAALGVACAVIVGPFVTDREGTKLKAYPDVVGVWTICSGETKGVKAGQTATDEECRVMADNRIAEFGSGVLRATPRLKGHPYQLAAATSLAYNIGAAAYAGSTVDREFDAGHWSAACDAFMAWNRATYAKPQNGLECRPRRDGKFSCAVPGLTNRRAAERGLCLTELPL